MPHIHLIGIGGTGLSAIATVLLQKGYTVSGSDLQASAATARLEQLGGQIFIGQRAENLPAQVDAVIISSAINAANPELQAARQRGLRVVKRDAWLGEMLAGYQTIAVAGTHGKTTTTAMIAFILQEAGLHPGFIVGSYVPQMAANAAAGQGSAFVIEADEYDHMFLGLRPQVAVITIVEWDHPDIFTTAADFFAAFTQFVQHVPADGLVIGCGDAPGVAQVTAAAAAPVVTYGLAAGNDWQATQVTLNQHGAYDFVVQPPAGLPPVSVSLQMPGQHNLLNGLAAIIAADRQGVELTQAAEILSRFQGTQRRFELKGRSNGITIIDDYAHHPTEVRATLAAARAKFDGQSIWAMFQPHTFSRTLALLDEFAGAFTDADHVVVVDIFPSREKDDGRVSSRDLVVKMKADHPDVRYVSTLEEAATLLAEQLTAPAVLLTLGAGPGYQVGEWVLEKLAG